MQRCCESHLSYPVEVEMYGSLDIRGGGFGVLYKSSSFIPADNYPILLNPEHYAFHIFLYASCNTLCYHNSCTKPCCRVLDRLSWQNKASYYLLICETSASSCNVQPPVCCEPCSRRGAYSLSPAPCSMRLTPTSSSPGSPGSHSSPSSPNSSRPTRDQHNQCSLLLRPKRRMTRREGKERKGGQYSGQCRTYAALG